jgi:uncharacterized protein (TIGR03084 family)
VTPPPDLNAVISDLVSEHSDLDRIVASVDRAGWDRPTPAVGWAVRDQISHLAYFDDVAALALGDPDAFVPISSAVTLAMESGEDPMLEHLSRGRAMEPSELFAWWRRARSELVRAAKVTDPQARVLWFGPPMGARSFLSARIMETWAHGQDIADTFGVQRAPTRRLRHIAHLGVNARAFSYVVRGMEPRSQPVRVELLSSEEDTWNWGPEDCPASVVGGALDFCLVVTRRRHVSDTNLVVTGEPAQEWMGIAQSFAGPPGPQRSSG